MTTEQAYANIGKRVRITIDVPNPKYGLHLYAGDTGVINTGADEIGFAPDCYEGMLKYAHEGMPFVANCELVRDVNDVSALPLFARLSV